MNNLPEYHKLSDIILNLLSYNNWFVVGMNRTWNRPNLLVSVKVWLMDWAWGLFTWSFLVLMLWRFGTDPNLYERRNILPGKC